MRTSRVTGEVQEDRAGRVLSPERVELDHEGWLGTHDLNERARRHVDPDSPCSHVRAERSAEEQ